VASISTAHAALSETSAHDSKQPSQSAHAVPAVRSIIIVGMRGAGKTRSVQYCIPHCNSNGCIDRLSDHTVFDDLPPHISLGAAAARALGLRFIDLDAVMCLSDQIRDPATGLPSSIKQYLANHTWPQFRTLEMQVHYAISSSSSQPEPMEREIDITLVRVYACRSVSSRC